MTDKISEAFDKALVVLEKADHNFDLLPDEVATFLLVHSAQGCEAQGAALTGIVATFPFDEPHMKEELRNKYMEENLDEDALEVKGWSDDLCGDEDVWVKLEAFYLRHQNVFGG